jgi:hypothetical protein
MNAVEDVLRTSAAIMIPNIHLSALRESTWPLPVSATRQKGRIVRSEAAIMLGSTATEESRLKLPSFSVPVKPWAVGVALLLNRIEG